MGAGRERLVTRRVLVRNVGERDGPVDKGIDGGGAGGGMHDLELRDLAVDQRAVACGIHRQQRRIHERTAAFRVDDERIRHAVTERHRAGVVDHLLAVVQREAKLQRSRRQLGERR